MKSADVSQDLSIPRIRIGWKDLIGLLLLLAIATGVRDWGIGKHCFWMDEAFSVQAAAGYTLGQFAGPTDQLLPQGWNSSDPFHGTFWQVATSTSGDVNPPLFSMLLRVWRQTFGTSDVAARWMTVIFGVAAIALMWDAVLHGTRGDRAAAWWTAAIMTLATPQIIYAQEVRSYTLLICFSALALSAAARTIALGPNVRRETVLAFALYGAWATHYFAASLMVAIILLGFAFRREVRGSIWRAAAIASSLFAITLGPIVLIQHANFHGLTSWIDDNDPGLLSRTLLRALGVPIRWVINPPQMSAAISAMSGLLLILPWVFVRRRPLLLLWLLPACGAIAIVVMADLVIHSHALDMIRYTLQGAAPAYALAAVLLPRSTGWLRFTLPAALLLGTIASLPEAYDQPMKVNWDTLALRIAKNTPKDEPLVFKQRAPNDYVPTVLQVGLTRYAGLASHPLLMLTRPPNDATIAELRDRKRFWLITDNGAQPGEHFMPNFHVTGRTAFAAFVGMGVEYEVDAATTQPLPAS